MKGLDLNERYYREAVRPALDAHFPRLRHAAALIGWGSEVLGFDDDISTDHNWGLRFWLFLSEKDVAEYSGQVDAVLSDDLPVEFLGFPIAFDYADKHAAGRPPRHNINIGTVNGYLNKYLGADFSGELTPADWLTFQQHKLLGVTAGRVFHDGLGELEVARTRLAYYPRDVWYYMLAAQWSRIFQEQAFIGRCGQAGDEIGSAVIAAGQIENLMGLCFLIERAYAPYSKWFGTAFSKLDVGVELESIFASVLAAGNWNDRQQKLASAYPIVIRRFNSLRIIEPMNDEIGPYFSRPMLAIQDESILDKLLAKIEDERVRNIGHTLGSVNQAIGNSALLDQTALTRRLKTIY